MAKIIYGDFFSEKNITYLLLINWFAPKKIIVSSLNKRLKLSLGLYLPGKGIWFFWSSVVVFTLAVWLIVGSHFISFDVDDRQKLVKNELDFFGQRHFLEMLVVLLPVGHRYAPNELKELCEIHTIVLWLALDFVWHRHLAEAVAYFDLVLWEQVGFDREQVNGFLELKPSFVDCLVAIVKFLETEDVGL